MKRGDLVRAKQGGCCSHHKTPGLYMKKEELGIVLEIDGPYVLLQVGNKKLWRMKQFLKVEFNASLIYEIY